MSTIAIPPFTDAQAERLRSFLAAPERPAGTLSFPKLSGFLFAVSCAPEFIKPSEWMPLVFNEAEPEYANPEEARDIIESMLSLYNHIGRGTFEGEPALPPGCEAAAEPTANFGPDAPLGAWAGGFAAGHDWLTRLWETYTPDELDVSLGSMLLVLSFFARRELGERYLKEFDTKGQTLESMAAQILRLLPEAMAGYAKLGRDLARVVERERERNREPAVSDKVGRNAPCPCGSGKKYKKCCGSGLTGC